MRNDNLIDLLINPPNLNKPCMKILHINYEFVVIFNVYSNISESLVCIQLYRHQNKHSSNFYMKLLSVQSHGLSLFFKSTLTVEFY